MFACLMCRFACVLCADLRMSHARCSVCIVCFACIMCGIQFGLCASFSLFYVQFAPTNPVASFRACLASLGRQDPNKGPREGTNKGPRKGPITPPLATGLYDVSKHQGVLMKCLPVYGHSTIDLRWTHNASH